MRPMMIAVFLAAWACTAAAAAPPPAAPVRPVTETIFGIKVTDNYRYMEALDAATIGWMKAQGDYTRGVLDAIAPRAALTRRLADFGASFGFVNQYQSYAGRAFYMEREPGSDNFDLMVKDARGVRKLVDLTALRAAHGGAPFAINYFLPSPDGAKVGVGISQGGSEEALLTVYDAASGAQIAGPIDRAQFGATAWSYDSRTLYFVRLKKLGPGDAPTEKYKDGTVDAWDLKSEPVPILGSTVGHGPAFGPNEFPALTLSVGAPLAAALSLNGVENELAMWLAPAAALNDPRTIWTPFVVRDDGVTGADFRGGEIFLLSHKAAPTFKVLSVKAGQPLSSATTLVPDEPGRVVESIHAASDALYVLVREGAYSRLLRIAAGTTKIETVALPYQGHVSEAFTASTVPGIALSYESWTVPPSEISYDPATRKFTDLKLGVQPAYDAADYAVQDLMAKAHDGVAVPLTLVMKKGAAGPRIVIMNGYGSYGVSDLPGFSPRMVAFLGEGGTAYADCHVRGGGEFGEAWRLGGKDANKPNTWRDFIACAEDLIRRGVTTRDKLFITGGSAGGILLGRAMTERPDLFGGVIDQVPAANTLRLEFSPDGPPNIPEFGTITDPQGFKNLYEMDSIQHVVAGTTYPPVLITTGLNDPRVSPWAPAKFAAALQASGTPNPVLLRIEAEAGHGIGSTKSQNDQLWGDVFAFVFWRAGRPGWQPAP
ncbi:MAG TPA: prolyl oligopeptidase family serine peptidase [Rhizomicrobium sp.]